MDARSIVAPSGARAVLQPDGSINVVWIQNAPYDEIELERSVNGGPWCVIATLPGDNVFHKDRDTAPGGSYAYRVRARIGGMWTGYSVTESVYTAPIEPESCSASRRSDLRVDVTWALAEEAIPASVLVERQADGGGWVQIAKLPGGTANFSDNSVTANHSYRYRVRTYNGNYSRYATSGTVYTTPAAPWPLSIERLDASTVSLGADTSGVRNATGYEVEADEGRGFSPRGSFASLPQDTAATAALTRFRVRSTRGSMASDWTDPVPVTEVRAPLAPSASGLPAVAPTGSKQALSWIPDHPDRSPQRQAQVEYGVGGSTKTVTIEGGATEWRVPADVMGKPCTVTARVRTKGLHSSWGAWGSTQSMRVERAPMVVITSPAIDGATVDRLPLTVRWEVTDATGVASQLVELVDADGVTVVSERVEGGSLSIGADGTSLPDGSEWTLRVTAISGSSIIAAAERLFTVRYAAPAKPVASVAYEEADMAAHILVVGGATRYEVDGTVLRGVMRGVEGGVEMLGTVNVGGGLVALAGLPDTESMSVSRVMPDGSSWLVASGLENGQRCVDPLPPLNADYTYAVTSFSPIGTSAQADVPARFETGCVAFNWGRAASICESMRFNPSWSRKVSRGRKLVRFADGGEVGGLPLAYESDAVEAGGKQQFTLLDLDQMRRLDRLAAEYSVCWYRDLYGGVRRCAVEWDMSADSPYSVVKASADMTDVRFEEAW